jgi:hypothetical protein
MYKFMGENHPELLRSRKKKNAGPKAGEGLPALRDLQEHEPHKEVREVASKANENLQYFMQVGGLKPNEGVTDLLTTEVTDLLTSSFSPFAIGWAARVPVDRFNELVLPGALVKDYQSGPRR